MQTPPLGHLSSDRAATPLLRERATWIVMAAFWAIAGLVACLLELGLSLAEPGEAPAWAGAAARLVYAALWWVATVFAVWLSDTVTLKDPRQFGVMLLHALAGAAAAVAWAAAAYAANVAIFPDWRPEGLLRMVSETYLTSYFVYLGIACLAHGVIFAREHRARELEALRAASLSAQAQLQALKMELQPHFLFNTLNAISALMHRDVRAANEMLVLLADMLQAALHNVHRQQVTLRQELDTLRLYVRIQQIRFGDRLRVVWQIDPGALDAGVPHLILQPLVENAIVHGIADRAGGGSVEIGAHRRGDRIELIVRDDGRGRAAAEPGFGLGIANTRARLAQLYGREHRFELSASEGGGTLALVSLPFLAMDAARAVPVVPDSAGAGRRAAR